MTYLQRATSPLDADFSRTATAAGIDRDVRAYHEVMRQAWERQQEAARLKVEQEALALVALGLPPEEFVPIPWTGPLSPSFAEMAREWEAPIRARVERKRELLAGAFTELAERLGEVAAIDWGTPPPVRPDGPVHVAGYDPTASPKD